MNSRSVVVLVLYASVMTGLTALIAELGATVARQAVHVLSFAENPDQPVSRVERGLEAQARVKEWQPVGHVIELRAAPPPPEASAVALASGMDEAEDADLPKPRPSPAPGVKPVKPRVAGWIRRAVRVSPPRNAVAESTARIIQRHLRAEM
ncbi:hypothetical protein HYPDE_32843 [Hyphomicrobium denitrificans 1NES1]|uniref:Uncharacterized protein n=1 Tax=Hyphomicrobium denitrificans 1NES1 TaxID=670307 RepID=N0BCI1_9HYPH|nr:hypothetical protein [Hyphomicrobium denitrificans]AGK58241.1 hypothetical protein HYPDE_32843 [Hyphomicrobium denitrificans 1NES1]